MGKVTDFSENHIFFSISLQFTQTALVTHNKVDGRIVALDEAGEVKWLAEDEQAATEGIADFEFGVFGLLHDELLFAQIAEGATAIGPPRHLDKVAFFELTGFDVRRQHLIGVAFLADALYKLFPIGKTKKTRQYLQCAVTGFVGTLDVTPEAFQGSGTHGLMCVIPNGTAEEDEVGGGLHLTLHTGLNLLFEFGYFGTGLIHAAKLRLFSD